MKNLLLLFSFLFLLASCQKDSSYPKNLTFHRLAMVVNLTSSGLDTLASSDIAYSLQKMEDAYSFYRDSKLIRNFRSEREYNFGEQHIGVFLVKNKVQYSSNGELITCDLLMQGPPWTILYDDYLLIVDYPFEGINCFEK